MWQICRAMNKPVSEKKVVKTLVDNCLAEGLKEVVISPGSRNAPLTITFAAHPEFNCYSIVDERSAGFFALGIAQQTQKPVALVCTKVHHRIWLNSLIVSRRFHLGVFYQRRRRSFLWAEN